MVAKPAAKKKKWFVDRCEDGCQICGTKFPHLKNNGLILGMQSIMSKLKLPWDKAREIWQCPNRR